jgi:hypothetical protein
MNDKSIESLTAPWDPIKHIEQSDYEPAIKKFLIALSDPEVQEYITHAYGEFARISKDPEMIAKHQEMLDERAKAKAKREARLKKLERALEIDKAVFARMEEEVRLHELHKHAGYVPPTAAEIRRSVLKSFNQRK